MDRSSRINLAVMKCLEEVAVSTSPPCVSAAKLLRPVTRDDVFTI
jgi:hypothetical protein